MRQTEDSLSSLQTKIFDREDDLDHLMISLESVAAKTYQRGLGAGFYNNDWWRAILVLGLRKKWVEVWTLLSDSNVISFIIGFKYKRRYVIYAKAFDPAYSSNGVGTYLQIKLLEEIARRGDCDLVDYGFGEADYKRQFSTDNWSEADVFIARASTRNFMIMNFVRFCKACDKLMRLVSDKLQITQRVKKTLRTRKMESAQEND